MKQFRRFRRLLRMFSEEHAAPCGIPWYRHFTLAQLQEMVSGPQDELLVNWERGRAVVFQKDAYRSRMTTYERTPVDTWARQGF